jgi:Ca-activated chloride channel family protein
LFGQGLYVGPDVAPASPAQPAVRQATAPLPGAPAPEPQRLWVTRTSVHAVIDDGAATMELEQTFHNGFGRQMEATWMLPLPAGAAADGFTMTVGDKQLTGEVLDASAARSVYEQIVRQRRDPGLLEYAGTGLLRARVFPIPAHGECTVKVRFRQVLAPLDGVFEWCWPLRAAQLGDAGAGEVTVDLTVRSQTPIKTVWATLRDAQILRRGECEAHVGLEIARDRVREADLRVLYGLSEKDFGLHLLPFRRAGQDGWFAMMLAPRRDWDAARSPAECIRFAIDTSGSMQGKKIEQARAALRTFVRTLRPGDWFDIVPFATEAAPFFGSPQQATADKVQEALRRIDGLEARGGTNIAEALRLVLAQTGQGPPAGLLSISVLVTDGTPTVGLRGVPELLELARQENKSGARLFVFGVGNDVNTQLLDRLAAEQRGARDYVREDEDIEVRTSALMHKVTAPVMTDVEVRCPELEGFDVFPRRTPDLFAGEMLQLVGRYRGEGTKTIRVRGKVAGAVREYEFPVVFPAQAARFDFVPSLWAQRKVNTLLDEIRLHGNARELVDEVSALSREYGIATPYTSHLILEEGMRLGARSGAAGGAALRGSGSPGPNGPSTPGPAGPATGGRGVIIDEPSDLLTQMERSRRRLDQGNWPTTGAEAVNDSVITGGDDFYLGPGRKMETRPTSLALTAQQSVRAVAGRAFYRVGERWVESGLPSDWEKQAKTVPAFSPEYFALLGSHPELKAVFALGIQMVVKIDQGVVAITQ